MGASDPSSLNIKEMQEFSKKFVKERDWEQYQTPKNVAMGVTIEASELMEIFQWLTDQQSYDIKNDPEKKGEIADEIGDILHYLIRLSTLLDIDLKDAFWNKIRKTEAKYPVDLVKGKKEKYTAYAQ
ncbi:MAG: nucleotide pyrophosphohydrolase [Chlamydiales bacterium]|nr:nucleotide pyrophosphohydrolase [Chlamydiia bacterium]MCP5504017.1 nucleotide pyrophosphohydrolase [Chlamydiales bacterium]